MTFGLEEKANINLKMIDLMSCPNKPVSVDDENHSDLASPLQFSGKLWEALGTPLASPGEALTSLCQPWL